MASTGNESRGFARALRIRASRPAELSSSSYLSLEQCERLPAWPLAFRPAARPLMKKDGSIGARNARVLRPLLFWRVILLFSAVGCHSRGEITRQSDDRLESILDIPLLVSSLSFSLSLSLSLSGAGGLACLLRPGISPFIFGRPAPRVSHWRRFPSISRSSSTRCRRRIFVTLI